MRYLVDLNGARVEVVLDGAGVTVAGDRVDAHLADVEGTPVRLVTIGGVQHRVVARRTGARGRYALWIDGWRFDVDALDERARAIRDLASASAEHAGPLPLIAPMPGLIVRVQVALGERVEAGRGVIVMEAMKMENELRASAAGVVRAIHAAPGAAVEKGAVLVEFGAPD